MVAPGVVLTVPPQVVVAVGLEAIVMPVPIVVKSSVKEVIFAGVFPVLVKVMVKVVCAPCTLVFGEKLLLIDTGVWRFTVKVALVLL